MIWLVGNKGMLGRELERMLGETGLEFLASDRETSILEPEAVNAFARNKGIRWIINCAAYTAVDKAEDEEELATKINAYGAENLARAAREMDAVLIHVSTDYVFDGTKSEPYLETDATHPIGAYGRGKLLGEELVRRSNPRHIIVRTAWLYGNTGPSFVHTMLRLMNDRAELKVVDDQIGSPTCTANLAAFICAMIGQKLDAYGIYHYSDGGRTSWHGFASKILEYGREAGLISRACSVLPVPSSEYPTRAVRPAFSLLCKDKIGTALHRAIPSWDESLKRFLLEDYHTWNAN